jgi:phage terminase large subunit-like protein
MFKGELKNMLMVSYSEGNAIELLKPIQIQLESNQRIINDFGQQKGFTNWESGRFSTLGGCSFRAIGTGQNPRGTRNEEARPDYVLCDDIDDDELCRNPKRLDNAHDWVWGALYGCLSIEGSKRFVIVGNIIAPDTLAKRAINVSDDHEQIDILCKTKEIDYLAIQRLTIEVETETDISKIKVLTESIKYLKEGWKPSWSERFSIVDCVYMIMKMGYRLSQREYFNNPISEGKVFKKNWFQFKKLPPLRSYTYLMAYLDGGFKKTATSDSKALVLVGLLNGEFHIVKVFVGQASIEEMVEWGYMMDEYVKRNHGTYTFKMEEVFLLDLVYKDFAAAAKTKGYPLPISGDKRKKPDKDARIEATSGYFERGSVFFNEDEKENLNTKELQEQYLNFESGVKSKKDGPDAVEGAFHLLSLSIGSNADNISVGKRHLNSNKV